MYIYTHFIYIYIYIHTCIYIYVFVMLVLAILIIRRRRRTIIMTNSCNNYGVDALHRLDVSGKLPVDMRSPPLDMKSTLESNPPRLRILVTELAVQPIFVLVLIIFKFGV